VIISTSQKNDKVSLNIYFLFQLQYNLVKPLPSVQPDFGVINSKTIVRWISPWLINGFPGVRTDDGGVAGVDGVRVCNKYNKNITYIENL
jgi:hypothetical protein